MVHRYNTVCQILAEKSNQYYQLTAYSVDNTSGIKLIILVIGVMFFPAAV